MFDAIIESILSGINNCFYCDPIVSEIVFQGSVVCYLSLHYSFSAADGVTLGEDIVFSGDPSGGEFLL